MPAPDNDSAMADAEGERRSGWWQRKIFGEAVFATWEEAELMEVSMTTDRGTGDANALGVEPRRMGDVLEEN